MGLYYAFSISDVNNNQFWYFGIHTHLLQQNKNVKAGAKFNKRYVLKRIFELSTFKVKKKTFKYFWSRYVNFQ